MNCLDGNHGDIRVEWDREKTPEVDLAKQFFEEKLSQGYLAYALDKTGRKGKQIHNFDADAHRIVLTKPVVGG